MRATLRTICNGCERTLGSMRASRYLALALSAEWEAATLPSDS